jgi:hypothetical protein
MNFEASDVRVVEGRPVFMSISTLNVIKAPMNL